MEVFRGAKNLTRPLREPVVAIGNFDGVHVGHRALLSKARQAARARGGEAVVLTFDPHPAKVLAPKLAPPLIANLEQKLELLAGIGVDACVLEPFSWELASKSPDEFVAENLVTLLHAREVVVGHDFTYGSKRQGDTKSLKEAGAAHGFQVHVIPAVTINGLVVSSTKVRELVLEGNVEGANLLLGRELEVDGVVVKGAGRGRSIGFPTANVVTENELLPRPGVYAGHLALLSAEGRDRWDAVISLGRNPTFVTEGELTLEVHVLEFDRDLYDQRVRVGFHSWLRGEERFPSVQSLLEQIHEDIGVARLRLSGKRS
ncbi:MAG: bifunctional riboflavin kinase/FAD synthetase [Deltaproteobacteria bacterium]|nr:bifunctional riboflavin kinase/FAD synthetase [Deltaproteobacteria bacterium]